MTGTLFTLTFAVAAPFWALMILLPHWSRTARIVHSAWPPTSGSGPGASGRRSFRSASRSA
ncbi:abscisic acid-deficient protein Aba4 family protein [Micromonospora sp. NPDC050200]|uniref:abscisic acid-deficient protein Aba4 family protein n=1 Tax=Micromonospora sp. NPDC050200 TaxID=3155664 RepID=UPI0033EF6EBB